MYSGGLGGKGCLKRAERGRIKGKAKRMAKGTERGH